MSYREKIYFPVFFSYHPEEFGIEDTLVVDYRSLSFSDRDWSLWPVIEWNPFEKNETVESYPSPPSGRNLSWNG